MTFSEGDTRQGNTDDPQLARLKTKQAPRGEIESAIHDKVHYTTKEVNEFPNSFKQKFGDYM